MYGVATCLGLETFYWKSEIQNPRSATIIQQLSQCPISLQHSTPQKPLRPAFAKLAIGALSLKITTSIAMMNPFKYLFVKSILLMPINSRLSRESTHEQSPNANRTNQSGYADWSDFGRCQFAKTIYRETFTRISRPHRRFDTTEPAY
jgi:hypothetical protein